MRNALFAIAALAVGLSACATTDEGPALGERVEIVAMGTTDLHGRLYPYDYYTGALEERGLARVATLVDSIRAAESHTLLVDSGDLLQGNPLDYYFGVVEPAEVHPVILAMNRLGYDAAAIGNHEFNYGIPALERALEDAGFPFLAANVFVAGTDERRWPAYTVVERSGLRIGILGLTTPGSAIWDRHHVGGRLEFRDGVESAKGVWPELEAASDVQVVVAHTGLGPGSSYDPAATGVSGENFGSRLAEELPGIEVVFLGHSHTDVEEVRENGVLFTQAGRWGEGLAVARIGVVREEAGWRVVDRSAETLSTADAEPDSAFLAALEPYHEKVVAYVADTIGWTPERWSTAGARLMDKAIIDLIHAVQLEETGADLSSASAFTEDARIGPGPITVADAAALYIYDNTLKAIEITGEQLREYLEYSAKHFHRTTEEGDLVDAGADTDVFVDSVPGYNYDMVAGVSYGVDLTRPVGDRIRNLEHEGEPVADGETFTMAINNYRQGGGGGYAMIADAPVVYDRQQPIRERLVEWIASRDTVRPADVHEIEWRIVPPAVATRWLKDTTAWRPSPRTSPEGADLEEILEREAERIEGEKHRRIEIVGPAALIEGVPPPLPATSDSVRIAILATNDFHGALEPQTPAWAEGDTIGGAAVLAAWLAEAAGRYPDAALHLDGGDVMQGTVISNLTAGRSTVDVMNAMGLDAAAVGNHEFDWGVDTLRARMDQAAFPWLVANAFEKESGERPEWARPVAWLEAGGLTVAVIGAATVSTPTTTMPANVAPYAFRDIATVANEIAPTLKREGADVVILLAHAGAVADADGVHHGEIVDAARRIDAPVDLIVSGHTHTRVDAEENGIPIVQAGASGTALGVVTLTYDRSAGRVVDHTIDVWTTRAEGVDPVAAIDSLVDRWAAEVAEVAKRPIATLATPLEDVRDRETALDDLIADAQRWATGTQVALMNGGGIRARLDAGDVTYEDVFRVQPFQNTLMRLELTAEQLRRALDHVVDDRLGAVSGIRFTFDPTRPVGDRIVDATLTDGDVAVVRDGEAVDPDATYTVTANNFMASGGSGYDALTEAVSATNTGLVDSEILAEYLDQLPQPVRYDPQGRIIRLAPWPGEGR
ncbi:MAG: 5'-nucleotidase C-terminal domain-containing protein [Gemmatimonadota bacterium]|nr:5'-nucleotidase C-terminal domain-containing protein [Gemmatimonadota bacterium]